MTIPKTTAVECSELIENPRCRVSLNLGSHGFYSNVDQREVHPLQDRRSSVYRFPCLDRLAISDSISGATALTRSLQEIPRRLNQLASILGCYSWLASICTAQLPGWAHSADSQTPIATSKLEGQSSKLLVASHKLAHSAKSRRCGWWT